MSLITNGITPDVIREIMPAYRLSPDLLVATFSAFPPPPPDATAAWRQARVARVMQEFATLMPANAAQARIVSQILIMRELADAVAARAYAPELTAEQMARVGRVSAELSRTATGLVRALERTQQKPAPFFGNVLADEVDVVALAAGWGERGTGAGPVQQAGGLGQEEPAPGRKEDPASNPRVERPGHAPCNCLARRSVPSAATPLEPVVKPRRRRHRRCHAASPALPAIPAPARPATGGKPGVEAIVTINPTQLSAMQLSTTYCLGRPWVAAPGPGVDYLLVSDAAKCGGGTPRRGPDGSVSASATRSKERRTEEAQRKVLVRFAGCPGGTTVRSASGGRCSVLCGGNPCLRRRDRPCPVAWWFRVRKVDWRHRPRTPSNCLPHLKLPRGAGPLEAVDQLVRSRPRRCRC